MASTLQSTIQIHLLRSNGTQIKRYDDPSSADVEPGTTSQFIELAAPETFISKIHIPASAPLDPRCEVVKIRLFVDRRKIQESNVPRTRGEDVDKILQETAVPPTEPGEREDEEDDREIVIQILQCYRKRNEENKHLLGSSIFQEENLEIAPLSMESTDEAVLAFTFHHRTHAELQLLPNIALQLAADWLASNPPPASNPQTRYVTSSDLEAAAKAFKEGELYCGCRKIILPPDWKQVERGLVGAITCDNDGCKVGTWHKFCVGMGDEEEPEMVWVCPECRGEVDADVENEVEGIGGEGRQEGLLVE